MKLKYSLILLVIFSLFNKKGLTQSNSTVDSLKNLLAQSTHDTLKCYYLVALVNANQDEAEVYKYNEELRKTALKNLKKNESNKFLYDRFYDYYGASLNNLGLYYELRGELEKALTYYEKSLQIQRNMNSEQGIASLLNNIAAIHTNRGNLIEALKIYLQCLKSLEKFNDKNSIATVLSNIGYIYSSQEDTVKAKECYEKSLKLYQEIKNTGGIIRTYDSFGGYYSKLKQYDKALMYYQLCLALSKKLDNMREIAYSYNSVGTTFLNTNQFSESRKYYDSALVLFKKLEDLDGESQILLNYATLCTKEKQYPNAINFCNRSLIISQKLGYPNKIQTAAKLLYKLYKKQGQFEKALENYELYIKMHDSLNNIATKKAALQAQFKDEYEKKETEIRTNSKIENEKLIIKAKEEKRIQNLIILSIALVLILTAIFLFFILKSLKQKKLANILITEQKTLVEEKQKEILDSINYAQRIQRALLASQTILNKNLNDHFILFKPKDIVSGDFYWASNSHNKFYFIIADSTGHGVPGAFMSLLNISFLNEAINEKNIQQPSLILDHVRTRLIQNLSEDGSEEGGKDGMDCSLLCFDFNSGILEFACANNTILIIRNGEFITTETDKMPVGRSPKEMNPFTHHSIKLEKNDLIYSFTDGYADQFGGNKNKKFMYKNLKNLILQNSNSSIKDQYESLNIKFKDWIGNLEQLDDVLIVGIKI